MGADLGSGPTALGAVVLAAGAGRRFGGGKLTARLDGRPLLQHVLDTIGEVHPVATVVVVPPFMSGLDGVMWRDERLVVNPDPGRGLASSLRLGIELCVGDARLAGAWILLGDQPRAARSTLMALAQALPDALAMAAIAVVPFYLGGGGANPVLLLRSGFPLVAMVDGDHGLGTLLATRPGLAHRVPIPGSNPDVDTPDDLRALQRPG